MKNTMVVVEWLLGEKMKNYRIAQYYLKFVLSGGRRTLGINSALT